MLRFLVDEDLPRSRARAMRVAGMDADDVRDGGLRGCDDAQVFRFALAEQRAPVTGDLGFSSILGFPLGSHPGIVVARFPNEVPTDVLNREILGAVDGLSEDDLRGNLVIVEPGRVRLRRRT